jgi:hypothetical protein
VRIVSFRRDGKGDTVVFSVDGVTELANPVVREDS